MEKTGIGTTIKAVFIDNGNDEDVKVEFVDNFEGPEGTGEYVKLTLKHFSPYAVYDAENDAISDAVVRDGNNADTSGNNTGIIRTGDKIHLVAGTLVFILLICGSLKCKVA